MFALGEALAHDLPETLPLDWAVLHEVQEHALKRAIAALQHARPGFCWAILEAKFQAFFEAEVRAAYPGVEPTEEQIAAIGEQAAARARLLVKLGRTPGELS